MMPFRFTVPFPSPVTGLRRGAPVLWALTLTACADAPPPSRTDESMMEARKQALERRALEVPPEEEEAAVTGEVPDRVMADVREHLAARTGGDPESFTVVRSEMHEWPSGAMGCPQPDLVYPQSTVSGYWIVLEHEGREYDYRVSEAGSVVLCEGMALENPPSR